MKKLLRLIVSIILSPVMIIGLIGIIIECFGHLIYKIFDSVLDCASKNINIICKKIKRDEGNND